MITFREVMKRYPSGYSTSISVSRKAIDRGKYICASCSTDDEDVLDSPAMFDIDASWQFDGGIGRYDNMHGELDFRIFMLMKRIEKKFGGSWRYSACHSAIVQVPPCLV